jgi:hypothetical protein
MATTKVCSKCNEEKGLGEFNKDKNKKLGVSTWCRDCVNEYNKSYYEINKTDIIAHVCEYQKTPEVREARKNWVNVENRREYMRIYANERRKSDVEFRILGNLRGRVGSAVKLKAKKAAKTTVLVGCSMDQLLTFLEAEFTEGMTWENMGEWHIDHIRPCASFNLEDPEEQKKCFHWTNLQPLWAADNFAKSDRLDWVKT